MEITLRRSTRARRFSLRVSRLDGRVTLSLPTRAREADALAFAREQEGWLRRALASVPSEATLRFGAEIPFEGQMIFLAPGTARAPQIAGDSLLVPGDEAQLARRVAAFLKTRARDRLVSASDRFASALGRPHAGVTLRDTRSRWGSCTHDGRLMYSWRLIMAPPAVLDYVCAHEVAHLAQMNHSPAFWAEVAQLMPDYQPWRQWLKRHGQTLHAYRFDGS
ncbi:MAG: SprT family zinc-dependent metalloprotease [Gemmobacter sp.]